jgi:hypothetical protein
MASNKEYHDFLQFLYFEGYAESYAEAEELLETLTDDEIEELNEARRKAHSFPLKPSERRSVENIRRALDGEEPSPRRTETRSARKAEPEAPKKKRTTDLKKVIIAQYLFDEGYADTPESAEVMSESISETWIQFIISEAPYQIYGPDPHGSSDSEPRRIGKPYKNKKRAKTRADKLDQEIGGYRHSVKYVDDGKN